MEKTISKTNLTQVQIFNHPSFGNVRTINGENGNVLFVARDVLAALGYKNISKALADHVAADDVTKSYPIVDSLGRRQKVSIINESGLYALILGAKLPSAKEFKHWVTSDVLPQIRRTGGYIPTRNPRTGERLTESEVVERANQIMQRTIARRNLPADDCLTASDIAQAMGMEVKELNKQLVKAGVQYWNGGRYKLTPKYADCGYAENRRFYYYALDGEKKERTYLVWTQAGKEFIEGRINKLTN